VTVTRAADRLDSIETAIDAVGRGVPVIVVDDADRENEGDVLLAAARAEPEWVGWTVRHSSGVICAPMTDERADALDLPPMVARNQDPRRTAYTVSVDAARGIGTGISATDRTRTVRVLADPSAGPGDVIRPGHVFPLRACPGGVLERLGHTEAAVDLCRLAGLPPVGVIAELVDDSGEVLRLPGLRALADEHDLVLVSVADLVEYRHRMGDAPLRVLPGGRSAPRVSRVAEADLPTRLGRFRVIGYRDSFTGAEHVAIVAGNPPVAGALVRLHSECLTGDALHSLRCDCGAQLDAALEAIGAGGGVVVYLRGHEGRGIGLGSKLAAYALQDGGLDTVAANTALGLPADAREYGAAAAVLADLGLDRVRLLTNNPAKADGLRAAGVRVGKVVALRVGANPHNRAYLRAKRDLMGHRLGDLEPAAGEGQVR
jgi:3,4-dihydroxy 2-butanone 4-phosphate synthase/GTP cyclohydrolase II